MESLEKKDNTLYKYSYAKYLCIWKTATATTFSMKTLYQN